MPLMNKMEFVPAILLPNPENTWREFYHYKERDHNELTVSKLYAIRRHENFAPYDLINIVEGSTKQSVAPLVQTIFESAKPHNFETNLRLLDTILSKGYFRKHFDEFGFYPVFLEAVGEAAADKHLAINGNLQSVKDDINEMISIYGKLNRYEARKALMNVPSSQIPILMAGRDDNSIYLSHKGIQTLVDYERHIIKKYHSKFITGKFPLSINKIDLSNNAADKLICMCLVDKGDVTSRIVTALLDEYHPWIFRSPVKLIVELYELLDFEVPDFLRLANMQPEMVKGDPNHIMVMLESHDIQITENILKLLYRDIGAQADIQKIMEYGYTKLAVELYDPTKNVNWSQYVSELVDIYDEMPQVEAILKTIDIQTILKNGKNISKFSWINHEHMEKFFDNTGNDTCAICLGSLTENQAIIKTACGHTFHYNCFRQVRDKSACPLCRQDPF